ncbi:quinone oxidoreductase family protein [Actinacidiphila acididurans]|uniref:Zinc-binding dehydrogenase n=1 Tax=Actinacidiphila acididurans TaxID=2784346 RepID=A0ABS2TNF9_9ACTN|nr:zinc-binding dehydrogenase [Actinacidiphila acididurans]MBM9504859.1 zinc-binding dehydrogenase [Actinacidiphila acididurans]
MRRVRYYEYGGPDVLTVEEADVPTPGPGEVLIRTEAVGANYVDVMFRAGTSPAPFTRPLPGKLTGDVVGTVEAVGEGADPALAGRRVAALVAEDGLADHVIAEAAWASTVPDGLDAAAATILPLAGPVALGALRVGRLAAGETVLVHAASGSIGHLALQLARELGAGTVIASVSSAERFGFVKEYGADVAVDNSRPDWADQVRAAAPGGVDVVLDSLGGDVMRASIDLLAPYGRAVVFGAATGDLGAVPVTALFPLRQAVGFSLLALRRSDPDTARANMAEIARLTAAGTLRAAVHARLPLDSAVEAHRILDSRAHRGRVVLLP